MRIFILTSTPCGVFYEQNKNHRTPTNPDGNAADRENGRKKIVVYQKLMKIVLCESVVLALFESVLFELLTMKTDKYKKSHGI